MQAAVARCEEELERNSGDDDTNDDDELPNHTNAGDSERPGRRYALGVVIRDSTDPADEYAGDVDGLNDMCTHVPDSTGPADKEIITETDPREESMEANPEEQLIETDDEDDSDTEFVSASNDCGLS
ncbi:hypothetical protein B5807_00172 [Epicoccum nigrum]|jgi:hypothetical protein|uniref:Uncharacterized protein n=1 Tax=Epicoccum nigrum TaxID=105696 RepID=A0A1Y2MGL0_EPING|nr:hypothetical protein B5807_00172 [Epicoccum nigrum]